MMATSVTDTQAGTPQVLASLPIVEDVERSDTSTPRMDTSWVSDIEHVQVDDDPRQWSPKLKAGILCMAFSTSMIAGLGCTILNPAIKQIETELKATSNQISPIFSVYLFLQGVGPLLWSAVSEIKGRKSVYIVCIVICLMGFIAAAEAKTIGILIGMRAIQAIGTSSFIANGAATLADIYDPANRGKMVGIFYAAPLFGLSLGPIIGGTLAQAFSWRAAMWMPAAFLGVDLVLFALFFRDTFRCERSLTYRHALARRRGGIRRVAIAPHRPAAEVFELPTNVKSESSVQVPAALAVLDTTIESKENACLGDAPMLASSQSDDATVRDDVQEKIVPSWADVNPFPPLLLVLQRRNNIPTLISSALLFGFSFSIPYTCSRTLSNAYNYDALKIGLVLLSFGAGSMLGSVLGGRWSDRELRRLTQANGGHHLPEMRLESTKPAAIALPLACLAYAWLAQKHMHVAVLCIPLFFSGFFTIWIYASTLAYIVDANPGRASAAVATNSCFRGASSAIVTLAAVPLQDSAGDGVLYTLWAGLLILCELSLLLVQVRGGPWRMTAEEREKARSSTSASQR